MQPKLPKVLKRTGLILAILSKQKQIGCGNSISLMVPHSYLPNPWSLPLAVFFSPILTLPSDLFSSKGILANVLQANT